MSAAVAVQDGPEHERRLADLEQRNKEVGLKRQSHQSRRLSGYIGAQNVRPENELGH